MVRRQSKGLGGSPFIPRITVFHCTNAVPDLDTLDADGFQVRSIKIPCSSIIREVFLLRAFESGADAVLVLACPEGRCRNINGNVRAAKRVARMKGMVDEIGLDGRRLNIFNVASGDRAAVEHILSQTLHDLAELGPLPLADLSVNASSRTEP
jgi:coenzyme F420-reducing hydrogenase delta subunit